MNVDTAQSTYLISVSHLHIPEIVKETDTQALTKLLLEDLHKALCWQKQTLAEAAMEIQNLLKQLKEINLTATEAEQKAYLTAAIPPKCRERFVSALQAGWKEVIQEFLEPAYFNIGIATLEAWKADD